MKFLAAALIATICPTIVQATPSVDSAYKVCAVFDRTGLTSEPCSVSGWNNSVRVTIDMSAGEARKLCTEIGNFARKEGWKFESGWKLEFYSPYSNGKTIAYCSL